MLNPDYRPVQLSQRVDWSTAQWDTFVEQMNREAKCRECRDSRVFGLVAMIFWVITARFMGGK